MELSQSMVLPRDVSTVPLVRHLCTFVLWQLGVALDCIADIELAITEACANVVEHATGDDEYDVTLTVTESECEVRIIDTGAGFVADPVNSLLSPSDAENGRGLGLMQSLVDSVAFDSVPAAGTVVHLVKRLRFEGPPPPPFEYRHLPLPD